MNMRFYTNEQVHQIVDELLIKLDEPPFMIQSLSTLTTKYRNNLRLKTKSR